MPLHSSVYHENGAAPPLCPDLPHSSPDAHFFADPRRKILLDEKRIRMLEILLQRQKMTTGLSGLDSIKEIRTAFLSCAYDKVPLDSLVIVRNVHNAHVDMKEPVRKYIQEFGGPERLNALDHSDCHLLVWEVCCKVPALEQRLECMMFASNFEGFYENARKRLDIL